MKAHARSWACRCGAHLILRFDMESGSQDVECPQFTCPRCRAIHRLAPIAGERIHASSVVVRQT